MTKKVLTFILAAVLALSLAACGGGAPAPSTAAAPAAPGPTAPADAAPTAEAPSEEITLSLWHIWASETESSKEPFEKTLAAFQEANPNVKLEIDMTENEAYKTKIRATVAANEAPDIYFYWGGGYMKGFVDAGKLLPLNDYLTSDGTIDRILPGTLDNATWNGNIYGLAHSMSVGTFFVNRELFEQNNVKIPTNYDEFLAACQAFLDKGITPLTVGGKDTWCIEMYFDLMQIRNAGFQACNAALSKAGTYEDPGIIDAAAKLQALNNMGAFGSGAMGITRDESEVPFYEGMVPMYVNGSWTIGNIMREDSIKDKVDIVSFPILSDKGDTGDYTGGAAEIFVIDADTEYKDQAAAALKYISENFSREVFAAGVGLPTWDVDTTGIEVDRLTAQLMDMLGTAKTYTLWWNTYLEGADSELYENKVAELFANQITPEQYAADIQTMNS